MMFLQPVMDAGFKKPAGNCCCVLSTSATKKLNVFFFEFFIFAGNLNHIVTDMFFKFNGIHDVFWLFNSVDWR